MRTVVISATLAAAAAVSVAALQTPAAPAKFPLAATLVRSHEGVQRNLIEAAEKMPEEHYGFKPTPEMRPFVQVVAHIALSRFGSCSALSGAANPHASERETQPLTKAQAVALLKEGSTYCAEALKGVTEETLTQFVKIGAAGNEVARGVFVAGETAHGNEVYGTIAVYLRLKGIVPPSTERAQQRRTQ